MHTPRLSNVFRCICCWGNGISWCNIWNNAIFTVFFLVWGVNPHSWVTFHVYEAWVFPARPTGIKHYACKCWLLSPLPLPLLTVQHSIAASTEQMASRVTQTTTEIHCLIPLALISAYADILIILGAFRWRGMSYLLISDFQLVIITAISKYWYTSKVGLQ